MSRSKILIVDDDVPMAGLLIELPIGEGFEAAHALSGAAAQAHLARHSFDLAILDAARRISTGSRF